MEDWAAMVEKIRNPRKRVTVALAGKYIDLKDAYKSVGDALLHGGIANDARVHIKYIDVESADLERELAEVQGIVVPGGFGDRGVEGKISVIQFARERGVPYLGLCLGMREEVRRNRVCAQCLRVEKRQLDRVQSQNLAPGHRHPGGTAAGSSQGWDHASRHLSLPD